ncbi:heme-binding protein [Thermobifida halotolerans]|uniref:Heme-binding protein n=1 Tax=Thermobifida halotolerans TaxID=483545 RepID=A0A399G3Y0_9ACTN|nr:heme-binding protein [Thermobifida halotolerans]UOE20932.1 heme-binding protein [Thermobifida halotolerans]
MKLTLADAEEIVEAALKSGQRIGRAFSVAVVDSGGFVVLIKRSDGARPLTPSIATAKAYTAAVMQRPGKLLKPWAESNPGFFAQLSTMGTHPIIASDGGVTIKRDGEILGGLGISGGTSEEDQQICDEVLEALGYELQFQAWGGAQQQTAAEEEERRDG